MVSNPLHLRGEFGTMGTPTQPDREEYWMDIARLITLLTDLTSTLFAFAGEGTAQSAALASVLTRVGEIQLSPPAA